MLNSFLAQKWWSETRKTIEILCTVVKNQGFVIFSSSRLRSSIGDPLGLHFGSLLASRWLQHGFQSSQDGSKTTQGASKTPLIRRLQDGSGSLQDLSMSAREEVLEIPSRLQELSGGAFQASSCCPVASSLWPLNGLSEMREALASTD